MRQINVSVVGLSGTEKDKGQMGIGKSCLCNRFIRPKTDDYYIDHITVLSQSDFSGRVVNNDHFLYWGEVRKTSDEGIDYNFSVVEQTEFIDDSTFQAFKVGKMDNYLKRCISTKICSAEKLMYICKNQLGIEDKFEEKVLPDGRITIDGFICVFDVSPVPNRSLEKQIEFCHHIIMNVMKAKKPIVVVTTKNDDADDSYVREVERWVQRKEYKGSVHMVETSAHEAINVDMGFILLAQLIDKTKNRSKIVSYQEAARIRKDLLDIRTEAVGRLIRNVITDYHTIWSQGNKLLSQHREWTDFIELFGQESGQRIFRRHMKKLKDDHLNKRLQQYMDGFVNALQDLIPDIGTLSNETDEDWNSVRNYLRNHVEFDMYFFDCQQAPWTDLSDVSDFEEEARIPFDVLDTAEAETVFKNHVNALQQEQKKLEMPKRYKKQFKKLLEETGYVTPGKHLSEVRVLFMGRECFEALSEHDCQQIYDSHQREIIEKAKMNFLELMLEHADLFQSYKSLDHVGTTVTQEDVKDITENIQDDPRFKMLDRLNQDRNIMIYQHLGFIHCPIREHCPAYPGCVDSVVEQIITSKKSSTMSSSSHQWKSQCETVLNLLIMGSEHLASDLLNDIRISCGSEGEYIYDNQTYYINYRIVNGENIELFKSIDFQSSGLICVYSNQQSFETLKDNLDKSLLSNQEFEDKFENLPVVLVFQPHDLKENEVSFLRSEGMRLSELLHCEFIDTTAAYCNTRARQQNKYVYEILNNLIRCMRLSEIKYDSDTYQPDQPDLRIVLCMFCGDPYQIENIIHPLLNEPTSTVTADKTILVDTFLGDSKKRVEFVIQSYHSASTFRDELIHGYALVYSTKRKSSLTNMNVFTMSVHTLPMQVIAITESGGANAFFTNELCQVLITEGNAIADRFGAHFLTTSQGQPLKFAYYTPFLKKVWDRKPEIEQLHLEEPVTLDSGEGTLEHSKHYHLPQPPPRHESYILKQTQGTDGSGSENYEHLPTRSLNSLNGRDEINSMKLNNLNQNNNKDKKSRHLYLLGEKDSMDDPYDDDDKDEKARLLHQGWLDDQLFISRDGDKADVRGSVRRNVVWNNFSGNHAFTTGRQRNNDSSFGNKIRPKGPSQTLKQPGKLNLKNFQLVSDAVARMNVTGETNLAEDDSDEMAEYAQIKDIYPSSHHQGPPQPPLPPSIPPPLATAGKKNNPLYKMPSHELISSPLTPSKNRPPPQQHQTFHHRDRHRGDFKEQKYSESDSDTSSSERKARGYDGYYKMNRKAQTHKRMRKKRSAIPVQPPKIPQIPQQAQPQTFVGNFVSPPEIPLNYQKSKTLEKSLMGESIVDVPSPRETNSPLFGVMSKLTGAETDKLLDLKKQQKTWKEEDKKLEKRRIKEEQARIRKIQDKEKEQEKKLKRKSKQNSKGSTGNGESLESALNSLPEFMQADGMSNIPIFLQKCIQFIEMEGLDSEGIYRVPGNRAHVDLLFQKFEEDTNVCVEALDVPVNAVATALKDFFSKRLPPLFDKDVMAELEDIAGSRMGSGKATMEIKTDRSCRLIALRALLNKLPVLNFEILKYIFQHFVRVSENSKLNSMDSKNLAICWWPTLIPIEFTDMGHFETLRPYLEDIVQTMIDQFPYLFCGKEAFVMV
ncbi:RhoGAPp190 family protein [Megaselia abdita]